MNNQQRLTAAAQAEDTANLLEHIAWTDVIQPKLLSIKQVLQDQLTNVTLGHPHPNNLTREQLAGQIYGINYVTELLKNILARGERALNDLHAQGFNIQF